MADAPKENPPKTVQINVQLDEQTALGEYINMARIFHNQTEFVLDALFLPPQSQTAKVLSRLILSPIHAKFLFNALGQNLKIYEEKFGVIEPKGGGGTQGSILH